MAKAHSKSGTAVNKAAKTERFYTVGYIRQDSRHLPTPAIHLKGLWLKEAGFDTGHRLTVKVMDGCLVLIPDNHNAREVQQLNMQHKEQMMAIKLGLHQLIITDY